MVAYDPNARFDVEVSEVELRRNGAGRMLMARRHRFVMVAVASLVLDLHGGAWNAKDDNMTGSMDRAIAESGAVDRLLQRGGGGPLKIEDCIQDVRSAMRWVKTHAAEFSGDPNRVVLMGGSAGGYLVEANILLDGPDTPGEDTSVSPRPAVAVLFNPVLNGAAGGWAEHLVGDRWKDLSPLQRVTREQPPTLILHGADDHTVGVPDTLDFQKRLLALGVRCELDLYPGQGHGFFNHPPYTLATILATDAFLTSLHLTAGPAPTQPNPLAPAMLPTVTK